jgi:hypothetical protein
MKIDPFYIVAGNRDQFDNFVIRKRVLGFNYDFKYVSDANVLRGLNKIRGFYIGDYKKHSDWPNIEMMIYIIKLKEKGVRDEYVV